MKIIKVKDYAQLSRKAANLVCAQLILKPDSVIGLVSGITPVGIYERLCELCQSGDLSFANAVAIALDEYRGVSTDSPQSCKRFLEDALLSRTDIKPENIHVPNGITPDVATECMRYDAFIDSVGGIDLQLLGIGENGHIGSNEPSDAFIMQTHRVILLERTRETLAHLFDGDVSLVPEEALTLGMGAIMRARGVLLCVSGTKKMDILDRALRGPITPRVPASILQLHNNCTVIYSEDE